MPDANTNLMQHIKSTLGDKIAAACAGSSVPPAFLAALIANESGGNPNAKRYEPTVCGHLAAVISGKEAAYDPPGARRPLGAQDLQRYLANAAVSGVPAGSTPIHQLTDVATSWGVTQIMGFHVLMWDLDLWQTLRATAESQIKFTLQMLADCAQKNQLDLSMPWDAQHSMDDTIGFFTWWNTGRTNGKTYDPDYVQNGIERMQIYRGLMVVDPDPTGPIQ